MDDDLRIECFCRRHPLLAVAGTDEEGRGYVHVKTWKKDRIYAEVVITSGTAHVRCRECLRWHKVTIRYAEVPQVHSEPAALPETLAI